MNTHDIKRYAVSGDIAYPIHEDPEGDYVTYDDHVAAIEADRRRMATVVESAWREGWKACRDSEYVGSEAEDSAYGDSEANSIALDLDQGEYCGLEADRKRRGEPVAGYTMVPVEPTPQMIAAFRSGFQNELHKNDRRRTMSAEEAGLRAMLKATPQPAEPVSTHHVHRGVESLPCYCIGKDDHPIGKETLEPVQLECPKCGADRAKEPCAGNLMNCAFKGEAHAAEPVKTLVDNQEPLGEEFQRVLDENRWDLYEKSTEPVKVPSDAEILDELQSHGALATSNAICAVRALLARYGQKERIMIRWIRVEGRWVMCQILKSGARIFPRSKTADRRMRD